MKNPNRFYAFALIVLTLMSVLQSVQIALLSEQINELKHLESVNWIAIEKLSNELRTMARFLAGVFA